MVNRCLMLNNCFGSDENIRNGSSFVTPTSPLILLTGGFLRVAGSAHGSDLIGNLSCAEVDDQDEVFWEEVAELPLQDYAPRRSGADSGNTGKTSFSANFVKILGQSFV